MTLRRIETFPFHPNFISQRGNPRCSLTRQTQCARVEHSSVPCSTCWNTCFLELKKDFPPVAERQKCDGKSSLIAKRERSGNGYLDSRFEHGPFCPENVIAGILWPEIGKGGGVRFSDCGKLVAKSVLLQRHCGMSDRGHSLIGKMSQRNA